MQGSKVSKILIVSLVAASFVVGRLSVKEKPPSAGPPPKAEKKKLTAIQPPTGNPAVTPPIAGANDTNPVPPSNSPQDRAKAKRIAETIAAMGDALDTQDDFEELSELITEWLNRDPDEAIAWLATGDRRSSVLKAIFIFWSSEDPEATQDWLYENRDLDGYQDAKYGLALGLAHNDQPGAALHFTHTIDDPIARTKIWEVAGPELYAINQDELREHLSSSDIPQNAQDIMLDHWETDFRNKSKRNAQNLASVFSSALAAGAKFEATTVAEFAQEIVTGVYGADSFAKTRFQVPNMSVGEMANALENLDLNDAGFLSYRPAEPDSEAR
jgi:hypothetical protein